MNLVNILAATHDVCSIGEAGASYADIANLTRLVVTILKIAIPVILVIYGILDLAKAVMANEEKEMKEAQKRLIKRIIYALVVFFVITLVQLLIKAVVPDNGGDTEQSKGNIAACITCFTTDGSYCEKEHH